MPQVLSGAAVATPAEREQLCEILSRDVLAEVSEQEKELMWRLRRTCLELPDSLPKLLTAVKWNSREDVAQVREHVLTSLFCVVVNPERNAHA